ncbi:MAG TPA: ABC transporter permease [Bacteroidia bacterium]|nr:ABC transporter permease [Bacteroidia bacterium]
MNSSVRSPSDRSLENIKVALSSIKGQMLRAVLTILIIALGIAALVGILASIDVIKSSLNSNFSSLGANTFTIRNRETTVRVGREGKQPRRHKAITYREAMQFADDFDYPGTVSVSTVASWSAVMKYKSEKTNPNIQVFGTDENYLLVSGYTLERGRNFSPQEVRGGDHVVILGKDLVGDLFKKEDPIGKEMSVGAGKYLVIGVLAPKGNSMGMGGDKVALLPIENVRSYFSRPDMTYTINVLADDPSLMDGTIGEATGLFRTVRKLEPGADDNFEITKSDSVATALIDNLSYVTLGATLIGIITLLGAAIGLMNIMLVSVTERTREIGIRKALGATKSAIRNQFLTEAIVICQIGGLLGIVLALIFGGLISFFMGGAFLLPWMWIGLGIGICFVVGLISGIYPAIKASNLDPIEALRYE